MIFCKYSIVNPKDSNVGGGLWWLEFHEKQTIGFDVGGGARLIFYFFIFDWFLVVVRCRWWGRVVGVFRFDCWVVCGGCGLALLGWFLVDLCLIYLGLILDLVWLIWDWWRDGAMRWRKTLGLVDLGFEEKRKVNWERERERERERNEWKMGFFCCCCLYYFNGLASYLYILRGF